MNENTKPQARSLGHVIDDESINRNVIAINALSAKSDYVFGKSSPIVTERDMIERELFGNDLIFSNSFTSAELHLRSMGLIPYWHKADKVRFHRHKWQHRSWSEYAGAK